jgi:hypothetical protein
MPSSDQMGAAVTSPARPASAGPVMMKAVAVFPGTPNSMHLAQLPKPSVDEVPGGRGVLVKVLRVGVDGTDKEINAAEYGAAPEGSGPGTMSWPPSAGPGAASTTGSAPTT